MDTRPEFLRYDRLAKAEELRAPYAFFLEPDLRPILVELETINRHYCELNLSLLRAWIGNGCWNLFLEETGDNQWRAQGLIIPPQLLSTRMVIKANGQILDGYCHPLPSRVDKFLLPKGDRQFGFSGIVDGNKLGYPERPIHFTCESETGAGVLPEHTDFWLLRSEAPLPAEANRTRISGPNAISAGNFLLDGSTFYKKMDPLTRRYLGKPLEKVASVLDWGVGCGKMIRHFPREQHPAVTGVDIDPVNINWCKSNLPGRQFAVVPKRPPTKLPANHYELIYGNSVFTHLREDDQFLWLAELNRIAKPGGLVLVTVHAHYSFALLGWCETYSLLTLLQNGMRIAENYNPDLGEFGKDSYFDVAHTQQYIIDRWSKYFNVLDILEGYGFGELALVVLQKSA
jgi:SAM-dependent methyltransferase